MVMPRLLASSMVLGLISSCSYVTNSFVINDFSGDPFPIQIDSSTGAVLVGFGAAGEAPRTAVLDVLSPFTLIDRGKAATPSINYPDVTLLGERMPNGPLDLPRAKLKEPQVLTLHPCLDDACTIGTPAASRSFEALVGVSAFASDALRLRLATDQIFILPDVGGDELNRTRICDAVLPFPFRGGGVLVIGGTEISFGGWRIAIDTCLQPTPGASLQSGRGTDALLVASSAIGISLLGVSAYTRYREVFPTSPDLGTLPDETVFLPSGPITGKRVTIPSLALVANSPSNPRAPCRQVYAHHLLAARDCQVPGEADCPCGPDIAFCGVPALLELAPSPGIDMLVVPDDTETLQALRTELRPDRPEVDGILGTDAIRTLELDIDYPHGRLLGRCTDGMACHARPELYDPNERPAVASCIGP
ncbi:MAG: hypothetical protein JWO36_5234 [Myxococcales bacterium]|nr:hypothetical protein [Myxococcales bacterium]